MIIKDLEYNIPIEVSEKQYRKVMSEGAGICAGREDNGKFYIKLWMSAYKDMVLKLLNIQ